MNIRWFSMSSPNELPYELATVQQVLFDKLVG